MPVRSEYERLFVFMCAVGPTKKSERAGSKAATRRPERLFVIVVGQESVQKWKERCKSGRSDSLGEVWLVRARGDERSKRLRFGSFFDADFEQI